MQWWIIDIHPSTGVMSKRINPEVPPRPADAKPTEGDTHRPWYQDVAHVHCPANDGVWGAHVQGVTLDEAKAATRLLLERWYIALTFQMAGAGPGLQPFGVPTGKPPEPMPRQAVEHFMDELGRLCKEVVCREVFPIREKLHVRDVIVDMEVNQSEKQLPKDFTPEGYCLPPGLTAEEYYQRLQARKADASSRQGYCS